MGQGVVGADHKIKGLLQVQRGKISQAKGDVGCNLGLQRADALSGLSQHGRSDIDARHCEPARGQVAGQPTCPRTQFEDFGPRLRQIDVDRFIAPDPRVSGGDDVVVQGAQRTFGVVGLGFDHGTSFCARRCA